MTEHGLSYCFWPGQEEKLFQGELPETERVAILEKQPGYPLMELVFRGPKHLELWLADGGDKDGEWIGDSPERLRERAKIELL